jgi:hypothetical protein
MTKILLIELNNSMTTFEKVQSNYENSFLE